MGQKPLKAPTELGGVGRGLMAGCHLYLSIMATRTALPGVEEAAMRKRSIGNLLALYFLRRRYPLGQTLPRHSELWNNHILREGLPLLVHMYRSFIIQVLSILSVRPRLDVQKVRECNSEKGRDLYEGYLIQCLPLNDKVILLLAYCQIPSQNNFSIYLFITIYTIQPSLPNYNTNCECQEEEISTYSERRRKKQNISLVQGEGYSSHKGGDIVW